MEWITSPEAWVALATLTAVEIVLGIDNIVFISILVGKLPPGVRDRARIIGLLAAMLSRIVLLLSLTWIMRLSAPLFTVFGNEISGRDLIMFGGGLFLLAKATVEIHGMLEGDGHHQDTKARGTFWSVIVQILILDVVFSLDSVITAVGLADDVPVMVLAIVIAVLVMLVASGPIARFVEHHPTVKMLALSFLLLIGLSLMAEGIEVHIPKTAIYFAMGFSVFVEMLNIRVRKKSSRSSDDRGAPGSPA